MQRMTKLFTKTRKTAPADEVAMNAQLLIRAGYVHKHMAGVYEYLPLGWRVLQNIMNVIREEMNALGALEVNMTALQNKELWEKTDRFDDAKVDNWFKTKLANGTETGLAITHEEPMTDMMKEYLGSYKDFPILTYQFQTKFRNETRAKSGIMRGREFIMKDLYSFTRDEAEHQEVYASVRAAYIRIFERLGIGATTYPTFASGGIFSKYSEEFQTVCDAGEDQIYIDDATKVAVNEEVYTDEVLADLKLEKGTLHQEKAAEVGNIFTLGTRFSETLGAVYTTADGQRVPAYMGSYGIGPARVMGVIVELLSDERGLVWPTNVAPYTLHVVGLSDDPKVLETIAAIESAGISTLYDDRDASAGTKFADADLLGMPYRITLGKKFVENGEIELKTRATGEERLVTLEQLIAAVRA